MLISYNWLQKYFKDKLPPAEKLAEALNWHAFEVEKIESKNGDYILNISTLPDRNCYALSHQGIVYEISAILDIPKQDQNSEDYKESETAALSIKIEDQSGCPRYIGRRIENVKVDQSPKWLKEKLESIGQRSINNIVDSANYVMFDMGQPLHAFDADKVKGGLTIRMVKNGEKITTLDNKEVKLDSSMLIISDDEGPLAIAGIKGGKKAEVTSVTKNIILEAANFDRKSVRQTAKKLGIQTDASKRFENGITSKFTEKGMKELTSGIAVLNPQAKIGKIVDIYPKPEKQTAITISPAMISEILGIKISEKEIIDFLKRLEIGVEKKDNELVLNIPPQRLDLQIPEDIAEEVGRLYGLEKIPEAKLPSIETNTSVDKHFYWSERIKDILVEDGFSEVMTHTLASKGDFEIEKAVASDKNFLRTNLSDEISEALKMNLHNGPSLGFDQKMMIKIFEIGKVFPKTGEYTSLCLGISDAKGYAEISSNEKIRQTREHLLKELDTKVMTLCTIDDTGGILVLKGKPIGKINEINGLMELNLDILISVLLELPKSYILKAEPGHYVLKGSEVRFKHISKYPFMVRDIAVFVPGPKGKEKEVLDLIKKEAKDLLIRADLFDVFEKKSEKDETMTSYAYHLVFQSPDRTLTDEEISKIMDQISQKMTEKGWKVR